MGVTDSGDGKRRPAVMIKIGEETVGLALPERSGFAFRAVNPRFGLLDGSRFRRIEQVQRATHRLAETLARAAAERNRLWVQ